VEGKEGDGRGRSVSRFVLFRGGFGLDCGCGLKCIEVEKSSVVVVFGLESGRREGGR